MRVSQVPEAEEVLIELGECPGDVDNLTRASGYVIGGIEAFLKSIARRAKYEFFLWKIVSKDHVGFLPRGIVYEGYGGWDTPYRVSMTKPEGEVQITIKTNLRCKVMDIDNRYKMIRS